MKLFQVVSKESFVIVAQAEFYTNMKTHKTELQIWHRYRSLLITLKAAIHCYLAIFTTSTPSSNPFHAIMHCDMSHL